MSLKQRNEQGNSSAIAGKHRRAGFLCAGDHRPSTARPALRIEVATNCESHELAWAAPRNCCRARVTRPARKFCLVYSCDQFVARACQCANMRSVGTTFTADTRTASHQVGSRPVLAVPGYSEIRQNQSFKPSPAEHRVAKSGCDGFVQAAASVITFSSSRDMRSSISAARCSCTG
jgi:hypothetical protein